MQRGLRGAPQRLGEGWVGLRVEGDAGDEGLGMLCEARSQLLREVVRAYHDDGHDFLQQHGHNGPQTNESELALHLPQLDAQVEHPLAVAMEVVHSLFAVSEDEGQKLSIASQLPQACDPFISERLYSGTVNIVVDDVPPSIESRRGAAKGFQTGQHRRGDVEQPLEGELTTDPQSRLYGQGTTWYNLIQVESARLLQNLGLLADAGGRRLSNPGVVMRKPHICPDGVNPCAPTRAG